MNLVEDYGSDNEMEVPSNQQSSLIPIGINPTPDVDTTSVEQQALIEAEYKNAKKPKAETKKNHLTGKVENWNMDGFTFDEQYHNFVKYGFAIDPNIEKQRIVIAKTQEGIQEQAQKENEITTASLHDPRFIAKSVFGLQTKEEKEAKKELRQKRKKFGDASQGDFLGPWASYEGTFLKVKSIIL